MAIYFRNSGYFRGCINIPLYLLRLKIGTLDPAKKYIMYCNTGHRSSAAAFIMNEHGLEAYVLEGGLAALSRGEDSREG